MMRILFLFFILLLNSCADNLGTAESESFGIIDEELGTTVTFQQLRDRVLAPKCLRCHAWVIDETEVLKRVEPGEPLASSLFNLVDNGSMPVGGPELSAVEKGIVQAYIQGLSADDDSPTDPTDIDPIDPVDPNDPTDPVQLVTYEDVKQEILVPHCIRCHSDMDTEAGLDRYIDHQDLQNSIVLTMVESGRMPARAPKLPEAQIQLLRDYLDSLSP